MNIYTSTFVLSEYRIILIIHHFWNASQMAFFSKSSLKAVRENEISISHVTWTHVSLQTFLKAWKPEIPNKSVWLDQIPNWLDKPSIFHFHNSLPTSNNRITHSLAATSSEVILSCAKTGVIRQTYGQLHDVVWDAQCRVYFSRKERKFSLIIPNWNDMKESYFRNISS